MCGIFGSIRLDGRPNDDLELVRRGVECIRHRGPDGSGAQADGPACLGHARLSIIDLATGQQPMYDSTGGGLIAFNGEVYNFHDLQPELEKAGRRFKTKSDTEVVLNAYLQWGRKSLSRLRGMFAFAAVDRARNTALLARDRVGKKPLYYCIKDDRLLFSSELEALYRTAGPFTLDRQALDEYLYWQYIPAPMTIYKEVRCLPAAHCLEIDLKSGAAKESRYWQLEFTEDCSLSTEDWERRLDTELRKAVELRLVSDVPFGAFLSGGIDSSLVVSYMAGIMKLPVKTFSIGFRNADYSELQYASQAAELYKTEHHTEIVEADSLSILTLLAKHYGQPFADSSAIPTFHVSKMARKHVKMVLSGDGGDENFAGYNTYENILRGMNEAQLPGSRCWGSGLKPLALYWYNRLKHWADADSRAYGMDCALYNYFPTELRQKMYRRELKTLAQDRPYRRQIFDEGRSLPLVSRLQRLDILTYLPYDILVKVDIAAMANSLEVRAPLLDHVLMETAASMPSGLKLRQAAEDGTRTYEKKYMLKRLALKKYPASMIERPKKGFGVPIGSWFAAELRQQVRGMLLESPRLPEFFEMSEIGKILDSHTAQADMSPKIWSLLFLDQWLALHEDCIR